MKYILLFIVIQCFINLNQAYKLDFDSDEYNIPKRYLNKPKRQYDLDHILYTSNNRQPNFYEDRLENRAYRQALSALAQAAQDEDNVDSSELSLDEFINSPITYDDIELSADPRDEESEAHSSLVAGHQYMSGGAGEGKQHLQPDGHVDNKDEVKTDEDLPAYCDPPNPCPVNYEGDDCDSRPYSEYTAEFSKKYQEQQNCMCDDDHNECSKSLKIKSNDKLNDLIKNIQNLELSKNKFSPVVAKKSPRIRRNVKSNETKTKKNPYLKGEAIKIHVAKKSAAL